MKRLFTLFLATALTFVSTSLAMAAKSSNSYDLNVDYLVGMRSFNEGDNSESLFTQGILLDGVCYFGKVVLGGEFQFGSWAAGEKQHYETQNSIMFLKGGMVLFDDNTSKISALVGYYQNGMNFIKDSSDVQEKISGFALGGLLKSQVTETLSVDGYVNAILGAGYTSNVDPEVAKTNFGFLYGAKFNYEIEIPNLTNKFLQLSAGFRFLNEIHSDPAGTLDHPDGQYFIHSMYLFTIGGGIIL